MQNQLAAAFCQSYEVHETIDYAEAFLRALNVIGTIEQSRSIRLSLSEIAERGLGECIQNCKLLNIEKLIYLFQHCPFLSFQLIFQDLCLKGRQIYLFDGKSFS